MREKWYPPVPERGLVASVAAGIRARYGYWPADFRALVERCCGGKIPPHVERQRAYLERERPWERCSHGVDLTQDHPFCKECLT
jgi:hypothetical protein